MNDLVVLANKYERREFLVGDPSWWMHQIEGETNKELLAFIAAALSYGSRKQFMKKIELLYTRIMEGAGGNVALWLTKGHYEADVPRSDESFYRLYSFAAMNDFLGALTMMVQQYGSIKAFLIKNMKTKEAIEALTLLTTWFREHGSKGIVPKDTTSSCKRLCMFLRWMVRSASPVDLGLWSDIIDRRTLIIPMDTHVVQEAMRLGLLASKSTSMANALRLSHRLAEIFPEDPIKGDFALFGLGVDD